MNVATVEQNKVDTVNDQQPDQFDQTTLPAFQKWFDGSKVTDAAGVPLRVFHATKSARAIHKFRGTTYFSDKRSFASGFGDKEIYEIYLNIKNPYLIDGEVGGRHFDWDKDDVAQFKAAGFDGVIVRHEDGDIFTTFDQSQIKSAVSNVGSFDVNNPDIRFDRESNQVDAPVISHLRLTPVEELQGELGAAVKALEAAGQSEGIFSVEAAAMLDDVLAGNTNVDRATALSEWLGNSQLVDDSNRPLLLYHGTTNDFSEFRVSESGSFGAGIYLTPDPTVADEFSFGDGQNIMPVYARMERPYFYDVRDDDLDGLAAHSLLYEVLSEEDADTIVREDRHDIDDRLTSAIADMGHDGIIVTYPEGSKEYVLFSASQIKSALGNNGAYDVLDADIRFSRDGGDASPLLSGRRSVIDRPEFKKWFGASKVAGEDGWPIVVYHGTDATFSAFDSSYSGTNTGNHGFLGSGIYFTDKERVAKNYGTNIITAHLKIERPAVITGNLEHDIKSLGLENLVPTGSEKTFGKILKTTDDVRAGLGMIDKFGGNREWFTDVSAVFNGKDYTIHSLTAVEVADDQYVRDRLVAHILHQEYGMPNINNMGVIGKAVSPTALTDALQKNGFDGIVGDGSDIIGINSKEYVVFDPAQIKWAVDNNGDYAASNTDIRFSRASADPILAAPACSVQIKEWLGASKVVDHQGQPLIVYRGEHGETDQQIHSRSGSISFGNKEAANIYAMEPNNHKDEAVASRIIPAYLRIENPIIDNRDDPFMDMSVLYQALGRDRALAIASRFSDAIEGTGNWYEHFMPDFDSVDQLLAQHPERLNELYLDAYRVLDDKEIVGWLRDAGFDGAIHLGNGATAAEEEFKVFDQSQIAFAIGNQIDVSHELSRKTRSSTVADSLAFKNWFGDSKIIDAAGQPQIYYHGTGVSISKFGSYRGANFFTPDVSFAEKFAATSADNQRELGNYEDDWGLASEDGGEGVYPVYLAVRNPFQPWNQDHVAKVAPTPSEMDRLAAGDYGDIEDYFQEIKKAGFDGFYEKESPSQPFWNVGVFDPRQIKSAIGNNGDYDATNSDIRFSRPASDQLQSTPSYSENFTKWFENSKVVDSEGKPLRVYHATRHDFDTFKPGGDNSKLSGKAIWCTPNAEFQPAAHNIGKRIGRLAEIKSEYDGVLYYDANGKLAEVIAFDSTQIKSAIGNNGQFDAENPNILFSRQASSLKAAAIFESELSAVKTLADFFKSKVVVLRTSADSTFQFSGASHGGMMWLNERTNRPLHVLFGHELLHLMKNEKPELYAGLCEAVAPLLKEQARYIEKNGLSGHSAGYVQEEMIADLVGDRFAEPTFWEQVSKHNKPLFRQVAGYVTGVIGNLLGKLKALGGKQTMGSENFVSDLNKARDAIAKTVSEYAFDRTEKADILKAVSTTLAENIDDELIAFYQTVTGKAASYDAVFDWVGDSLKDETNSKKILDIALKRGYISHRNYDVLSPRTKESVGVDKTWLLINRSKSGTVKPETASPMVEP